MSELRLSMDYYRRKTGSKSVKKLILCGKDDLSELASKFQAELNIPTEIMDFSKVAEGIKFESVGGILAVGSAMNGLSLDAQVVNLLPLKTKIQKIKLKRQYPLIIRIGILFILSFVMYSLIIVNQAKLHYHGVLNAAKGLPSTTESMPIEVLENFSSKSAKKIEFMKSLIKEKVFVSEKLSRVAADLPEGVWVNALQLQALPDSKMSLYLKGRVFLKEQSEQISAANKFLYSLKNDAVFMKGLNACELGTLKNDTTRGYEITNYSIECRNKK
ncbi:MAG: hypothetical protein JW946_00315, partial [Candidatus Omnitrophica bacterium]|nr:hypothetical protein [Candidatus Omnitrophota bacterium]